MSRAHAVVASPVGPLTLVVDGEALVGLYFEGHLRRPPASTFGERDDERLAAAAGQLGEYFAGDRTSFDLLVDPPGDAFKQRVWALLREIPSGTTTTYGALAAELGNPHLAQAVGHANALNPVSIVVPCHRVVGADGRLTGYAGGLARKEFLLDLETPGLDHGGRLF